MRDYFAEQTEATGLIRRSKDFEAIYLDTAGPEPALPAQYVSPDAHLTRDERACINATNTARAIQGRPDITGYERHQILVRLSS